MAFSDSTGKYRLVYSSPRVQTGSGKIASPSIDWDNASNTLSINVVDLNTPIIIAFHLGVKVTLGPKFRQARPGSGTYEPIDVDEEGKSKSKVRILSSISPFARSINSQLLSAFFCVWDWLHWLPILLDQVPQFQNCQALARRSLWSYGSHPHPDPLSLTPTDPCTQWS